MTDEGLQALGSKLQEARESLALTLEEVEAQTRIRMKYLQALEAGEIDVLPSTMHARGFLRNYAQFLELDVSQVIAEFSEYTGVQSTGVTRSTVLPTSYGQPAYPPQHSRETTEISDSADSSEEPDSAPEEDVPPSPVPPLSGARSRYVPPTQWQGPAGPARAGRPDRQRPEEQEAQPRDSEQKEPGTFARIIRSSIFTLVILIAALGGIVWWTTSRLSQISGDELAPLTSDNRSAESVNDDSPTLTASPTDQTTSETEAPSGPTIFDRVVLSITVVQPTWAHIEVDEALAFEGQLEPGEVLEYEAEEMIYLRAGNAAGLEVNYNGQPLGALGERGDVLDSIFTVDELLTPTPTPTTLPTATGVPTPTPRATATPDT